MAGRAADGSLADMQNHAEPCGASAQLVPLGPDLTDMLLLSTRQRLTDASFQPNNAKGRFYHANEIYVYKEVAVSAVGESPNWKAERKDL